ncbi:MAG: hypothetical protein V1824_00515, partial [archaeon]
RQKAERDVTTFFDELKDFNLDGYDKFKKDFGADLKDMLFRLNCNSSKLGLKKDIDSKKLWAIRDGLTKLDPYFKVKIMRQMCDTLGINYVKEIK